MMKSLALECTSILAIEIGKENFQKYFNDYMMLLINIQINDVSVNSEDDNIEKSYMLKTWKRIIEIFGNDCAPYINQIIPNLIEKSITKS